MKVFPENDEIRNWRRTASEGRAADQAAAAERRRATRDAELSRFKFEFVKIPPGEFMMGCSAGDSECFDWEKPAHRIRITKEFELGRYEVT